MALVNGTNTRYISYRMGRIGDFTIPIDSGVVTVIVSGLAAGTVGDYGLVPRPDPNVLTSNAQDDDIVMAQ